MNIYMRIMSTAVVATIALLGLASTAFAQSVNIDASASIDAQVKPLRPIDLLKQRREQAGEIKDDMRARQLDAMTDAKNASSGPERRAIFQGARDQNSDAREDAREVRGTFRDRLHALVQTHIGTIVRRFNMALERFDNLIGRMESRIEKLQDEDVDTADVEASLSISIDLVDTAKADVQGLVDIIESVTDESERDTVRAELRAAIRQTIENVKAAHRGLLSTAKMLVELVRTSRVDISAETEVDVNVE